MPRRLFAAALALVAIPAASVFAITYGFVDTNGTDSNAGAFIVGRRDRRNLPHMQRHVDRTNVFLTASHCTVFVEQDLQPLGYTAYVSFEACSGTAVRPARRHSSSRCSRSSRTRPTHRPRTTPATSPCCSWIRRTRRHRARRRCRPPGCSKRS